MTIEKTYHVPVLLQQSVEGLIIRPDGVYVDVTFGGGGHSRYILSKLGAGGRLFSFDQDADAEQRVLNGTWNPDETLSGIDNRFTFIRSNFRYLKNWMRYYGIDQLDGVLADLGVSSHHFDDESRGFSFRFDAPLDMRMNKQSGKTAAMILNEYGEEELADLFYMYGELRNSRRLAASIVRYRVQKPILTTANLTDAVSALVRKDREKKELAKIFQALRIEVNHEMDALKEMLQAAAELLRPGGRLSVITYHSLEDRMVKNMMKAGNVEGKSEQDFFGRVSAPFVMLGKVITPDADEQNENPRSRSAKLRIAEKK